MGQGCRGNEEVHRRQSLATTGQAPMDPRVRVGQSLIGGRHREATARLADSPSLGLGLGMKLRPNEKLAQDEDAHRQGFAAMIGEPAPCWTVHATP